MFQLPDDDDEFWKEIPLEDQCLSSVALGKENVVQENTLPALRSVPCEVQETVSRYEPAKLSVNRQSCMVQEPVRLGTSSSNKPSELSTHPGVCSNTKKNTYPESTGGRSGKFSFRHASKSEGSCVTSPALSCTSNNSSPRLNTEASVYHHNPSTTTGRHIVRNMGTPTCGVDGNMNTGGRYIHSLKTPDPERHKYMADTKDSGRNNNTPIYSGNINAKSCTHTPDGKSMATPGDYVTPRRKRKFPGPAGILPQLGPGQSLDQLDGIVPPTSTYKQQKSPQDDATMLSSQTTESMFSEVTWQQLVSDLGEDGSKLMNKFSIASTLFNAGKKQLPQGKAPILFGMVEAIENHGSEARVTVRDKSGKMEGTVHQDLLKEYERELQVGTVLVLKQVSILSLSARKHYLNITPSNVVMVYHQDQGGLRSVPCHGSQDSLSSVLQALETRAASVGSSSSSSVHSTPKSSSGSSRCSRPGSSTGTPQLDVSAGGCVSPRLIFDSMPQELRTPMRGVRDVSVVGKNRTPSVTPAGSMSVYDRLGSLGKTPGNIGNNGSVQYNNTVKLIENNATTMVSATRSQLGGSRCVTESNSPSARFMNRVAATPSSSVEKSAAQSWVLQSNCAGEDRDTDVSRVQGLSREPSNKPPVQGRWRFKPHTPVRSDSATAANTLSRPCQIGGCKDLTSDNCLQAPNQEQVSRSRFGRSDVSSNGNVHCHGGVPSGKINVQTAPNCQDEQAKQTLQDQDLWGDGMDDDLTDEILSQL